MPVDWRVASPGYFETMRIPLLRGRDFTDSDTATAPSVMIVSRATARTFWGDEDPIGRTVRRVADGKDFTVVGIVGDVRSTTLNRESPALYYSGGYADLAADGRRGADAGRPDVGHDRGPPEDQAHGSRSCRWRTSGR